LFQAVRFGEIEFSFSMAILIGWDDAYDAPDCLAARIYEQRRTQDPERRCGR
jgi:hypothetical protein